MKSPRPLALQGQTYEQSCACGKVYVILNNRKGKLFEVFVRLGKSGTCGAAMANSTAVSSSIALRSGADPRDLAKGLVGIQCHKSSPELHGVPAVLSCMDAIGQAIELHVGGGDDVAVV